MSIWLNLRVNDTDDLYISLFIVDVVERLSPGSPHSDMPSTRNVSPISKSNLKVPKCFGVTSIPF